MAESESAVEGMDETEAAREGEERGDEQDNTGNTATADKQVDVETIGSLDNSKQDGDGGGGADEQQQQQQQQQESDGPPDYTTQKQEIHPLLSQRLKCGDCWYLVDQHWLKQWKKYAGFVSRDMRSAGKQETNPGPIDNSNLFKTTQSNVLKDHLMEELDYYLVPKAAWEKFEQWYGLSQGSKPIERFVVEYGTYVKHLKVEVYLVEFKLCVHPHVNKLKIEHFSRACTIAQLQAKLCTLFEVPEDVECRLWQRYMTYELLSKPTQSISDAGLYGGQVIMLEKKTVDGIWPRPLRLGLCGLSNLGNTCFMNSALQCLINTQPLTEYFTGRDGAKKPYIKHINKTNPLGMGGALAETYGQLLEDIWGGKTSYLAPREFKVMIGRHAPQFLVDMSLSTHQDSHELLVFLLDGLHEDLNLVKKKPYVDMDIKTEERSDGDIAEETWQKYLLGNQSVIVRYFQGQLKSTLVCPNCSKVSRIFDPFMYLSLPLPTKRTREITIVLVRADPSAEVMKYKLTVSKQGCVTDLKKELQRVTEIECTKMVVVDVYNSRFHRVYYDNDNLQSIMERDDIYIYELQKLFGDPDWVPVPVYHRELKTSRGYTYSGSTKNYTYDVVSGLPIIVTVPRKGCSYSALYDIITTQCSRYVTLPVEQLPPPSSDKEGKSACCNVGLKKDNMIGEDEREKDEEKSKERLFQLVVVKSHGSQEVNRLTDDDKLLKLTSQTYIACDWEPEVLEKHYNMEVAMETTKHSSCDVVSQAKKTFDIYDCLEMFAGTETLGEDDAWYCPSCKDIVRATKKFDLWKLPEVLVIHFKRFSYTRYYRNKLELLIDFPVNGLDLSNYIVNEDEPQPVYDLYAVSNHFGGLGGSHYTAYAKNKETGKWYNFDDSHVSEASANQVVSSSAYVLFYHRRTEGRPTARAQLSRSLSVSFAEQVKKGQRFHKALNTKSSQLETMSQDLVVARQELKTNQHMVTELQSELAAAQVQAQIYEQDFLQERKDRESAHGKLTDLKDQSAAKVNRLKSRIRDLEKEKADRATVAYQLQEDYQISQSQIIAYKKQIDIGKRELEEERKKVEDERMEVEQKQTTIERKQTIIDRLNNQLRLLSTENAQLISNSQMESTRADRLQNELEHVTAQNRDLERMNVQLRVTNQTLQQQLVTKHAVAVEGLSEGKERGRGSYGAVYEVRVNGVPCIAKRLHDILVGRGGQEPVGAEQRAGAISKFKQECDLLSGLRHPNVVQFMGVHYGRDEADISLIMEYMHMDLEHCMKTYPNIPLPYKTSILRDVAYGLAYLHSIPIIHRDLNAGNVLLTESLRAKIADLGVAKLFDREVAMRRTRTLCPGAQDFMPPESLSRSPKYSDKLDVFSFGHLTIYLVNQEAPHVEDSSVTEGDFKKRQMQVGKRRETLDQMGGPRHPLYTTVVQCLSDTPDKRPTSRDLVRRMEQTCQQFPIPHKNTLELEKQLKSSNQVLQTRIIQSKTQ